MRRAEARVDLAAIEHNARTLAAAAGDAELCAVVKADGYGHGAVPAARAALAGGATWLAVATAAEAVALREAGIGGVPVLVMGALTREEVALAVGHRADVVAWTPELVAWAADAAAGAAPATGGEPARVHVKLDTGMGRLGTRDPEAALAVADLTARTEGVALVGGMTHFATADEDDPGFLHTQLSRFRAWGDRLLARHPEVLLHAANSAATLREPRARLDLVRCGVALYGLDPFGVDPAAHGLRPALELVSWVAAVKAAAPGESAGYGRRFVAAHPTRIATVPVGYGDGWRRGLTNDADVLVRGRRRALVGTVSMDNVTLEVDDDVATGDEAVLLGRRGEEAVLAEEVARRLGTINYEVTCGIGPRVPRVYAPVPAPS